MNAINPMMPTNWTVSKVTANGLEQNYYRTGGNKPSLLLLHGFSENGLCWSRVARALEPDFEVIMPDARGHGLSGGPETGYNPELLIEDTVEFIKVLGVNKPILIGHSNGALTAAGVAAAQPELVTATVVIDPPWREEVRPMPVSSGGEPWPGFNAWYNSWLDWHIALRNQTPEERLASSARFLPPGSANWEKEEFFNHLEAQAQFNLDVMNFAPFVPTATPWRSTVERIQGPLLLIMGNPKLGAFVTTAEAAHIMEASYKGRLLNFEEAGHFMYRGLTAEKFDNFISVLKGHLQQFPANIRY